MNANLRAAGYVLAAMSLFGGSDAAVKLLAGHYPVGQIMGCRGLLVCVLLGCLLWRRGERLSIPALAQRANLLRGLCEVAIATCWFHGLAALPLAEATSILFVFPVLLTVLGALVLRERVGPQRWLAVGAGLLGTLVVMRPGSAGFDIAAFWPLGAAVAIAARDLVTRYIDRSLGTLQIALATTAMVTLAGFATIGADWRMIDAPGLAGFLATALFSGTGFLCIVEGTRSGDMSFTAPFRYIGIPLAFALGWLIWGRLPDLWVVAGSVLIVAAGLAVVRRERRVA